MNLLPGDILLWRIDKGAPLIDRLIGWGERRLKQDHSDVVNYYHVSFVSMNTAKMYSAQPPKIDLYWIPDPLPAYVEIYRVRQGLSDKQRTTIFRYAQMRCGKPYDFLGVLTGGFVEVGGLEFCSKYTNDSYSYGNITLCPSQELISPDDIAASPQLVFVV